MNLYNKLSTKYISVENVKTFNTEFNYVGILGNMLLNGEL